MEKGIRHWNTLGTCGHLFLAFTLILSVVTILPAEESPKLYWSSNEGINRAEIDGTNPELLVAAENTRGFVIEPNTNTLFYSSYLLGGIFRADPDGSNLQHLVQDVDIPYFLDLDVIRRKIYWTDLVEGLRRSNYDGTNVETVIDDESGQLHNLLAMAVDYKRGYVYFGAEESSVESEETISSIFRLNVANSEIEKLVINVQSSGLDVDIDSGVVFYSELKVGIFQYDPDTKQTKLLLSSTDLIRGLKVETGGDTLLFAKPLVGTISRLDINTGATNVILSAEIPIQPDILIPLEKDDLVCLTEFTDAWFSPNNGGTFSAPFRANFLGFRMNPSGGKKTMAGDFNGDSLMDLAMITEFGDVWLSFNQNGESMSGTVKQSNGWLVDPANNVMVFAGDFDGDGLADVVQLNGTGDAFAGWNIGGAIAAPVSVGNGGTGYNASNNYEVHDVDSDGDDDIVVVSNTSINAIRYNGSGFESVSLGDAPLQPGGELLLGDFNGDGLVDAASINQGLTGIQVYLLDETRQYNDDATRWSLNNGLHSGMQVDGYWQLFSGDANGDGKDDIIQLTGNGEVWLSLSAGDAFAPPYKDSSLGFHHQPDGPWQVFVGRAD